MVMWHEPAPVFTMVRHTNYVHPKAALKEYAAGCLEMKSGFVQKFQCIRLSMKGPTAPWDCIPQYYHEESHVHLFILRCIHWSLFFCPYYSDTSETYIERPMNKWHIFPCLLWSNQYTSQRIINNNAWIFFSVWWIEWWAVPCISESS